MYKNCAFWKNGIQKKKMNFERTLFDQSTSSQVKDNENLGETLLLLVYDFVIFRH
jgi:hypothetical protein